MLQRLLFIMSVTSATSGVLADGEQGDARGGKQHNGHTYGAMAAPVLAVVAVVVPDWSPVPVAGT